MFRESFLDDLIRVKRLGPFLFSGRGDVARSRGLGNGFLADVVAVETGGPSR